jgi:TRAP-type C4-dicarboxylate transport system permease small subunit
MKWLYKAICTLELVISASFLLLTVFVIFIAAISRTFGYPLNWALDLALLVFTWGVFLAADLSYRENKFLNVDFILAKLPKTVQRTVEFIIYLIILAFLVFLVYQGSILSVFTRHRTFQGIPSLSYTWVTVSIPLCSFLMVISTLIKLNKIMRKTQPT